MMAFEPLMSPPDASPQYEARSRPLKDETWESHKDTIQNLYGNLSLKDVMNIMDRDYGFRATDKQYKRRLRKWDLHKNISVKDIEPFLHESDSVVSIRGQEVPLQKIKRFRRQVQKKQKLTVNDEPPSPVSHLGSMLDPQQPPDVPGSALTQANFIPTAHSTSQTQELNPIAQLREGHSEIEDTPDTFYDTMRCLMLLRMADRMVTEGQDTHVGEYMARSLPRITAGTDNESGLHLAGGFAMRLYYDKDTAPSLPTPLVWQCKTRRLTYSVVVVACIYLHRLLNLSKSGFWRLRYEPRQRTNPDPTVERHLQPPPYRFAQEEHDPPARKTNVMLFMALSMAERHFSGSTLRETRGKVDFMSTDGHMGIMYRLLALNLEHDVTHNHPDFYFDINDREYEAWKQGLSRMESDFLRASWLTT